MKREKISVSPYILIPAIFSGISLIVVIVTSHVMFSYSGLKTDPGGAILWLGLASIFFSFICSYLILRFILSPITRFVKTAEKFPVMQPSPDKAATQPENIEHIQRVLDQVTTILSKVEVRELFPEIIGQSRAMRAIFGQIMKVAPTDSTILISGESGTGKELIAAGIYEQSLRKGKSFIKLNCVAIPEGLLESELFGHEKGSFTGATARKKGKFELADGGTIFLDEIGDMPIATQAKLLRVLQEKEFERVGGTDSIGVDVRFIAATNKNLMEMVKNGAFREDLFYRLNVFSIHLPPLRERREDIPFIVGRFLQESKKVIEISPEAMQVLLKYDWPGNVRELRNVVERAAVIAEGIIEPAHFPVGLAEEMPGSFSGRTDDGRSLDDRMGDIEKGIIIEAISRAGGMQSRAAQILGINQRSLWHRVKKYNIDVSSLKKPQNY
ncbi:MAG: sigma-54-dependent Fis family transcriptional regulator [Desulfobacteraceae bacterium]|nr:MAG: sigma-54-dependent Fis family transcriptional regulator [Desulfobacteraceae bacterium]